MGFFDFIPIIGPAIGAGIDAIFGPDEEEVAKIRAQGRPRTEEQKAALAQLLRHRQRIAPPFRDLSGINFSELSSMTGLDDLRNKFATIQTKLAERGKQPFQKAPVASPDIINPFMGGG